MVSPETTLQVKIGTKSPSLVAVAEPARISFSAELTDDDSFISISPGSSLDKDEIDFGREMAKNVAAEFEFLSGKNSLDGGNTTMLTADELFFEGKLLPYCQVNHAAEQLTRLNLKSPETTTTNNNNNSNNNTKVDSQRKHNRVNENTIILTRDQPEPRIWFVDDDPSPRPPKCTVLWKELLRLKKQRGGSTLSPSSSSSSTSSSSSSLGDAAAMEEKEKEESGLSTREKHMRRIKKGLERTRSATLRIRPMVNVPICAHTGKSNSIPPLFPLRKAKVDR
ncbi:hypothetical protein RND81_12G069400 [Saponaria officinalis]|uniref:Uncharacterized protein n=1 Tax=Saponaria officinalis TaxID=3572 RepID=A0AAW1H7H9_SAPOF